MNSELMAFAIPAVCIFIGFVLGRLERREAQSRMYRHGFNIGKAVGRNDR